MTTAEQPIAVRDRLALALDVDDLVAAMRLGRELRPWFGVAKVGLELFSAAGPDAIGALRRPRLRGVPRPEAPRHPDDRRRAARVSAPLGADYLTLHAQGGVACCAPASTGLPRAPSGAGLAPRRSALAVTVLTSDGDAPAAHPRRSASAPRSRPAAAASCAPASDVRDAAQFAPRLTIVVPGIRPAGAARTTRPRRHPARGARCRRRPARDRPRRHRGVRPLRRRREPGQLDRLNAGFLGVSRSRQRPRTKRTCWRPG